jgi:hypothetical protein
MTGRPQRQGLAMWRGADRRIEPARGVTTALRVAAFLSVAAAFAGCSSSSGLPPAFTDINMGGTTIAFESIDGPPETVFRNLVQQLNQEAQARQVAVVSREAAASYRIRGYVAAHVQGKKTMISWVWDVYDADRQRALRLSGEEAGAAGRSAWEAADGDVTSRIARNGMTRLAAFLGSSPAPGAQPPAAPTEAPPNVALAPVDSGVLAFAPPDRPQ